MGRTSSRRTTSRRPAAATVQMNEINDSRWHRFAWGLADCITQDEQQRFCTTLRDFSLPRPTVCVSCTRTIFRMTKYIMHLNVGFICDHDVKIPLRVVEGGTTQAAHARLASRQDNRRGLSQSSLHGTFFCELPDASRTLEIQTSVG
jgi:hypothetical protein